MEEWIAASWGIYGYVQPYNIILAYYALNFSTFSVNMEREVYYVKR